MLFIINSVGGYHFNGDTAASDKLIITSAGLADSVELGSLGGKWAVTVDGIVFGAFTLDAGSAPGSKITIGRTGIVQNGGAGVWLQSDVTFKNSGQITGGDTGIYLSEGNSHVIINSGTIGGGHSILASNGSSKDSVTNTGMLKGDVSLGDGEDHLFNSGAIFGDVALGEGNDFFKQSGKGFVRDIIYLGFGDDTFVGGAGAENVTGDEGDDKIDLGGGNDTFNAFSGDGSDVVKGGSGIDTYVVGGSGGVVINLDTVKHGDLLANSVVGAVASPTAPDKVFGFENATGGSGGDTIYGTKGSNVLDGGNGVDILYGLGGNDVLYGGAGDASVDFLIGGAGGDTLYGGGGGDHFIFNAVTESGVTTATRDVIMDFTHAAGTAGDVIDLREIDANTKLDGNNTFSLIGDANFSIGQAGQLRAQPITDISGAVTGVLLEGEVNGDGKADFSILVKCNAQLVAGAPGVGGDIWL